MSIYSQIYYKLCEDRKQHINKYAHGSGIHKHHIVPKHCGGSDDSSNLTYLTVREHIIAHFLLWKMFKNTNDLRSMKMLGANLSVHHRRIIGLWCKDNNIGIHGASLEDREIWRSRGIETQKNMPNSWYFWSTPEGRKKRASIGGKIGGKKQHIENIGIFDPSVRLQNASLGGKSHVGKVWINKDGKNTRIFKSELSRYLHEGWVEGVRQRNPKRSSDNVF